MRKALEKAGVEFTNVKRPGVRMNLPPKLQPGKGRLSADPPPKPLKFKDC